MSTYMVFTRDKTLNGPIIEGLGAVGLNRRDHGWTRILEKPLGRDPASAHALNDVASPGRAKSMVYLEEEFDEPN